MLRSDIARLAALQDIFFAREHDALPIVFQGMDGAGKDGAIEHVMTGVEPLGIDVSHDYLRRANQKLPPRDCGELAVVRVHPEVLARGSSRSIR